MSTAIRLTDQLEKPELDDRQYRVIQLENGMEILLIHDWNTDKASASATVSAGSFSDGGLPGAAHAVMHWLFLGSEKFPQENEYTKCLAAYSGSPKATTGYTDTAFSFEIVATEKHEAREAGDQAAFKSAQPAKAPLYETLDRFAQFFVQPRFLQSSLEGVLKVIDSAYQKNLQSDQRRIAQLLRSLSNPEHPFCRFSIGNLQTLSQERGVDVRSTLMEFHQSHVSAKGIKVVILGRESLDELEKWTVELFLDVQNKNLVQNRWDDIPLFHRLCMQVFAKPIMDYRQLSIHFPFLDEEDLYETLPSRYISHLLGYGGSGSILSYLKAKGWATKISSYATPVCSGSAYFSISVSLTEEGLTNYQDIVKVIFYYIGIIKERAPEEWVFNELKKLAEIDFQFEPKLSAEAFTSKLSSVMLKPLPREWLLSHSLLRKFDAELITKALSHLRSDNFRLMIVSQHFPCDWDAKEEWYGTEYKEEKIPEDFLKEIANALVSSHHNGIQALRMPSKNEFIPHFLSVKKIEVAHPAASPEVIHCDEDIRVWYKKDDRFGFPKASVHTTLRTLLKWTPANYIKARLYCDLVTDGLAEDLYDAKLAGLSFDITLSRVGLVFFVRGYNEKMPVLLEKVVSMMRKVTVDPERFMIIKERLTRAYRNMEYQQPSYQVTQLLRVLTEEDMWTIDEYTAEIEHVKANDIKSFFPQLFQQNYVEVLAHGNLHQEEVLNMTETIKSLQSRPLTQSQWHVRRDIDFSPGSNYTYRQQLTNLSIVNNCILYYLYIGSVDDDTLRAKLILLQQICGEPVFDQLRTKEQLGYDVQSGVRYSAMTMGYFVLVQSERAARYLESRINLFLTSFAQTLEDMPNEEFETQKHSAITRLMAKFEDLYDETMFFWERIQSEDFQFLRHETEATLLKNLTKADLLDFYHQYINPMSETRVKLSIHLTAHSMFDESTEALEAQPSNWEPVYIRDVGQFKATLPLSPGPVSSLPVQAFMSSSHYD